MNRIIPCLVRRQHQSSLRGLFQRQQLYYRPISTSIRNLQSNSADPTQTASGENRSSDVDARNTADEAEKNIAAEADKNHAAEAEKNHVDKPSSAGPTEEQQRLISEVGRHHETEIKLKQMTNLYQRSLADSENLRTRTKRDIEQAHQYGIQKFAKDMLVISDTLALAIDSVKLETLELSKELRDLHQGLTLTSNELHKTLHRHGVTRIDAVEGDKFDPAVHQAVYQAPGNEPGTLLTVIKSGFKLNGRVLRPVQVGVVQEKN